MGVLRERQDGEDPFVRFVRDSLGLDGESEGPQHSVVGVVDLQAPVRELVTGCGHEGDRQARHRLKQGGDAVALSGCQVAGDHDDLGSPCIGCDSPNSRFLEGLGSGTGQGCVVLQTACLEGVDETLDTGEVAESACPEGVLHLAVGTHEGDGDVVGPSTDSQLDGDGREDLAGHVLFPNQCEGTQVFQVHEDVTILGILAQRDQGRVWGGDALQVSLVELVGRVRLVEPHSRVRGALPRAWELVWLSEIELELRRSQTCCAQRGKWLPRCRAVSRERAKCLVDVIQGQRVGNGAHRLLYRRIGSRRQGDVVPEGAATVLHPAARAQQRDDTGSEEGPDTEHGPDRNRIVSLGRCLLDVLLDARVLTGGGSHRGRCSLRRRCGSRRGSHLRLGALLVVLRSTLVGIGVRCSRRRCFCERVLGRGSHRLGGLGCGESDRPSGVDEVGVGDVRSPALVRVPGCCEQLRPSVSIAEFVVGDLPEGIALLHHDGVRLCGGVVDDRRRGCLGGGLRVGSSCRLGHWRRRFCGRRVRQPRCHEEQEDATDEVLGRELRQAEARHPGCLNAADTCDDLEEKRHHQDGPTHPRDHGEQAQDEGAVVAGGERVDELVPCGEAVGERGDSSDQESPGDSEDEDQ